MRKILITIAVLSTLLVALPVPGAGATGFFTDDDGSIHERAIEAIADAGITRGCNPPVNDEFCPAAAVTRGQMAAFLVRALGLTDDGGGNSFVDDDGSVFEGDIAKLAAAGITKGCNPPVNDEFCPAAAVTRGQMAAFLVRALGLVDDGGGNSFVDDDGSVFEGDIAKLAAAGITKGCNPPDNDRYCPDDPVTRAQMATFLARALHLDVSPRLVVNAIPDAAGIPFGTSESAAVGGLTALFGSPTDDYKVGCPYFAPEITMRYLRWGSLIVAIRIVDTVDGAAGLVGWRYRLDSTGTAEPGGPAAGHIELPLGLELLDPIGNAASAPGGGPIETTDQSWAIVDFGYFIVGATGDTVDPGAPIDGAQQGFGFDCG